VQYVRKLSGKKVPGARGAREKSDLKISAFPESFGRANNTAILCIYLYFNTISIKNNTANCKKDTSNGKKDTANEKKDTANGGFEYCNPEILPPRTPFAPLTVFSNPRPYTTCPKLRAGGATPATPCHPKKESLTYPPHLRGSRVVNPYVLLP
jgi:hypothetical protein